MAQKSTGGRKKARSYSQDSIMLRYMAGIGLTALGVMIFLAVALGMTGNVFQGLRNLCCGLFGALAMILPVPVLWAGVLMIWSAQRPAPVKPWIFVSLAFLAACSFIVLVTRTGSGQDYFSYLASGTRNGWGDMIRAAFENCAVYRHSGGGIGALLAWPLWRWLGGFLGAVITFLLMLSCLLLAAGLTPARIRALASGQGDKRKKEREQERIENERRQLEWQRQQAYEQEMQRRRLEEQQYAQQQSGRQSMESVEAWQEQMTAQQAANRGTGHQSIIFNQSAGGSAASGQAGQQDLRQEKQPSRIFGRQNAATEPAEEQGKKRRSGIFGRKEKDDGLTDPQAIRLRRLPEETGPGQNRFPQERPVQPLLNSDAADIQEPDSRETRKTEGPEQRYGRQEPEEGQADSARKSRINRYSDDPEETDTADGRKTAGKRSRRSDVQQAADPAENAKNTDRQEIQVPAVQQEIGREAYQPKLKLPGKKKEEDAGEDFWTPAPYYCPPITDLAVPRPNTENTAEEDAMRSRRLEETLANFKVQARVLNVTHGPAISRFELELAPGIKVSKVAELTRDIAYGMEATSVRIEAPIPGKSLVGVEVPNRKVTTVTLREVLESERMQKGKEKSILTVALGKDLAGVPIVCDLAKMPHMLIAGQTGSGKSVCINAIINSLLFNEAGPDYIKMILVDPKVVELQCYNGIPHLLIPVVNDPHKAAAALAWAVAEMMERYDRFAERRVRNLEGYNNDLAPGEKPMPRIVIIIDELADLMRVCKKDVEEYICRLTQLARAAGIHLIVATQRPSVDVITGLIKANIPSRIAFKTASNVDSRTILDRNGSEQLLGWGDMLYLPTGSFAPTRVQGCFLSDEEVNRVVADVRKANPCVYDQNILDKLDELSRGGSADASGADLVGGPAEGGTGDRDLFEQAVELALADGQISTSTLQRRLKIGYARAGRLTDEMEERGIVAAKDGSKPRKCLITREQWDEIKRQTEGMT